MKPAVLSTAPEPRRPALVAAACALFVGAAVVAIHWPVLRTQALSIDDDQYLTKNPLVQSPGWSSTGRFLSEVLTPSSVEGYYQPLTMISLMLDYGMGGRPDHLRPFHRTSLALHAANTVLVFVLLHLLFGNPWVATLVSLAFGAHPMTVESLAWVSDRKTVLAACFALCSLICYVGHTRSRHWHAYAACVLAFVLALMSKPTTTLLPAMMLVMDFWPLRRLGRRAVLEKVPLFAVAAASAVITMVSQGRTADVGLPTHGSSPRIVLGFCHNIVFYFSKMAWPANLTSVYPQPQPMSLSNPAVLAGVVGTVVLIVVLLAALRWTRAPLAGWLMFMAVILPTMGGIGFTIVIASDKYAYLPSVGLLMVMASAVLAAWPTAGPRSAVRAGLIAALLGTLVVAEGLRSRAYLRKWATSESLARHMISLAPDSAPLHSGLGALYASQGRLDEAIAEYERALACDPDYPQALSNLGGALVEKGQYQRGAGYLVRVLRRYPRFADGYINLGAAYYRGGRPDLAVQAYDAAVRTKPLNGEAHMNLGVSLASIGRLPEALSHLQRAVELLPHDPDARSNLANGLLADGRLPEALAQYAHALRLRPDAAETRNNYASALAQSGDLPAAEAQYREAIRLKPAYADAYVNLGDLLARAGRRPEAAGEYQAALTIAPGHPRAKAGLAAMGK